MPRSSAAVVLAVKAAAILTQFLLGPVQFALLFTNALAVALAQFLAQVTLLFTNLMDIVAQFAAGDAGLGNTGQGQTGDNQSGKQNSLHGGLLGWVDRPFCRPAKTAPRKLNPAKTPVAGRRQSVAECRSLLTSPWA